MPFEKAQDVFPMKVTPDWGKGALGAWRSQGWSTGKPGGATIRTSLQGKPTLAGMGLPRALCRLKHGELQARKPYRLGLQVSPGLGDEISLRRAWRGCRPAMS